MLQQIEVCHMITYSSWITVSQCSLSVLYWWRGFGFNTQETDSKTALKPASPAWCNEMTYGVFWYINHYGGGSTVTKKRRFQHIQTRFIKHQLKWRFVCFPLTFHAEDAFDSLKCNFILNFFVIFQALHAWEPSTMLSSLPTPRETSPPWIYCSIIKPTQVQNTKTPQINHQLRETDGVL